MSRRDPTQAQHSLRVSLLLEELLPGLEEVELGDEAVEAARIAAVDDWDHAEAKCSHPVGYRTQNLFRMCNRTWGAHDVVHLLVRTISACEYRRPRENPDHSSLGAEHRIEALASLSRASLITS